MNKDTEKKSASFLEGLLGGALSLTLSNLVVKILGLIYKIPLSRILGDEGMGYFNSAYTVFGLFYLLCTAGVPKGVTILFLDEETCDGGGVIETLLKVFFGLGAAMTLILVFLSSPISRLIGNSGAMLTVMAVAPSVAFVALGGVLRGFLSAKSRFLDIAVSGIIEGASRFALGLLFAVIAAKNGFGLQAVSAFSILGTTFGTMFGCLYLYKTSKSEIKTGQSIDKSKLKGIIKSILKISAPITLSSAVMSLGGIIDLGIVMRRLSDVGFSESVASSLYGNYTTLAVPMFNFAISLITPISMIFLPGMTRALRCGDDVAYSRLNTFSVNTVSFISAPLTFGFAAYSYELLALIFGRESSALGSGFLTALSPAVAIFSLLTVINTWLEARGKLRAPLYSMLVCAMVKIIVGYVLVGEESFGILGAPVGTVTSYAAALVVSFVFYIKSSGKSKITFTAAVPYYLFAFVAVAVSRGAYLYLSNGVLNLSALLLSIALCALIYLVFTCLYIKIFKIEISLLAKYTNFAS